MWRRPDSNRWPFACKANALANWATTPFSTPERIRTPNCWFGISRVTITTTDAVEPLTRIELITCWLQISCSNQLSYRGDCGAGGTRTPQGGSFTDSASIHSIPHFWGRRGIRTRTPAFDTDKLFSRQSPLPRIFRISLPFLNPIYQRTPFYL